MVNGKWEMVNSAVCLSFTVYHLPSIKYVSNKFNENGREKKTFLSRCRQGKAFKA